MGASVGLLGIEKVKRAERRSISGWGRRMRVDKSEMDSETDMPWHYVY